MPKPNIERALGAINPGRLHELIALYDLLTRAGLDMAALRRYLDERTAAAAERLARENEQVRLYNEQARRCPDCGRVMQLYPVNTGPRDQVGGGFHSQWACPGRDCMETIYNRETVDQLMAAMGFSAARAPRQPAAVTHKKGGCCNGAA